MELGYNRRTASKKTSFRSTRVGSKVKVGACHKANHNKSVRKVLTDGREGESGEDDVGDDVHSDVDLDLALSDNEYGDEEEYTMLVSLFIWVCGPPSMVGRRIRTKGLSRRPNYSRIHP